MAHTPGPWSIKDGARTFYIHGSEDKYIIAEAEMNYADPQRESNARLIAVAPELLAELKAASETLGLLATAAEKRGVITDHARKRQLDIRDAIAKAEPDTA